MGVKSNEHRRKDEAPQKWQKLRSRLIWKPHGTRQHAYENSACVQDKAAAEGEPKPAKPVIGRRTSSGRVSKMVSSSFYGADPSGRSVACNQRWAASSRRAQQPERLSSRPSTPTQTRTVPLSPPSCRGSGSDDLNISVHRDSVTLSSERRTDADEARGYHRRERHQGRFNRTVALPFQIDPDRVEAS
jgi:hypothetical protein